MMAKSHIAVGMAAAITVTMPHDASGALPVIAGAAAGCLICDIDCDIAEEKRDSSKWRIAMAVLVLAVLIEDHMIGGGMWDSLQENIWFIGLAGFALTCTFAGISSHRGFSHSLLACALETFWLRLIFPAMAMPFATAFLSHIILDLMNKKPVRVLYPLKKGWCLGWFYANRLANRVFEVIGAVWLVIIAAVCIRGK